MTQYEKTSSVLGILGFLVSLVALALAGWGHYRANELHAERMLFDEEHRKSKVVVQIGRDLQQRSVTFTEYKGPWEYGAVFRQRYNVVLNNIGFQPASITDWQVLGRTSMISEETGEHLYGGFNGMGPWFYTADGIEEVLPITIDPNKPRKLIIEVGVLVPSAAWNAVAHQFRFDDNYDYYEAEAAFSERGHPQFGQYALNQVSRHGGLTTMAYGPGPYHQDFLLHLTKGNGVRVSAKFLPSISASFVQGENSGTSWEDVAN